MISSEQNDESPNCGHLIIIYSFYTILMIGDVQQQNNIPEMLAMRRSSTEFYFPEEDRDLQE